jgi:hypothetical protein
VERGEKIEIFEIKGRKGVRPWLNERRSSPDVIRIME